MVERDEPAGLLVWSAMQGREMNKARKRTAILAAILFLAGCGRDAYENSKEELPPMEQEEEPAQEQELSSFWFEMTTFYGDTEGNDFDGGRLRGGIMKTGDKAMFVCKDGISYETSIKRIALYDAEDTIHPIPSEEVGDDSLAFVWLEGVTPNQMHYGDFLLGLKEWEQGIPVDFPFGESEEYFLTLAPCEEEHSQGELRLYDKEGEVVQRIPYGIFDQPFFYVVRKNDRRNLVLFPDSKSDTGRFLEWDGSRFSEKETDIKRGQMRSAVDLLITEETSTKLAREIYRPHLNDKEAEIIRYYELEKDTGDLEIWDCLDEKSLFRETVPMEEEGRPVNESYYQVIFTEGLYSWGEEEGAFVPVDVSSFTNAANEVCTKYESREAFLSDYGFADSPPLYQYDDRIGNLRLELYRDKEKDLFCGITYRYFYNSEKQKYADLYGFVADDMGEGEWGDDTYSILSSIDSYGYEKEIEYTPDQRPRHFLATGPDEISDDGEFVEMMEISYIYRDDGTLYDRYYWHNPNQFSTYRQTESSLYDEKGRLVYENAYITHGILEDYYIYLDEGEKPAYRIELDHAGGPAPNVSMERYD